MCALKCLEISKTYSNYNRKNWVFENDLPMYIRIHNSNSTALGRKKPTKY